MDLNRQRGSSEDFETDWQFALAGNPQSFLIYPSERPVKQFDLFEYSKAELVTEILKRKNCFGSRVLEYGCGAAGMSIFLANHGFLSFACDLSDYALQLAGLNAQAHPGNSSNYFFRTRADTFTLPFDDAAFDVVMSYGLLEHFNPEMVTLVIAEVMRVLRPGGLFIADIAHGRFSVRKLGVWLSLVSSLVFHAITLRWRRLRDLPRSYTAHYYENELNDQDWIQVVQNAGVRNVQLQICHPFPPLALSGRLERLYVSGLLLMRPLWEWFHRVQPAWGRSWGWLYLVWGEKPGETSNLSGIPDER